MSGLVAAYGCRTGSGWEALVSPVAQVRVLGPDLHKFLSGYPVLPGVEIGPFVTGRRSHTAADAPTGLLLPVHLARLASGPALCAGAGLTAAEVIEDHVLLLRFLFAVSSLPFRACCFDSFITARLHALACAVARQVSLVRIHRGAP